VRLNPFSALANQIFFFVTRKMPATSTDV
jgi:hypothetical protein